MATYATKLAEGFSQKVVSLFFEKSIAMDITNQDYEGEIKDKLTKLNILTFGAIATRTYSGTTMASADDATESVGVLETSVQRAYYFKIQSLQRFHSWIKNPENSLLETVAKTLAQEVDAYVLSFEPDVAAGNRVGTDVTGSGTGTTITITTQTGAFTVNAGTPMTQAMVGKGIKAVGHSKWYRISVVTNSNTGYIIDDLDDGLPLTYPYNGGTITTALYTIEQATKLTVAYNTLYGYIAKLQEKLNRAQAPATDRYLIVPPEIYTILVQTTQLIPSVSESYQEVVKRGYVGDVCGFKVMMNTQVAGDATVGWQVIACHKSWLTFAMGWVESGIEDLIGDFGKAYKGLNIYGAKVVDERRKMGASMLCGV